MKENVSDSSAEDLHIEQNNSVTLIGLMILSSDKILRQFIGNIDCTRRNL